MKNLLLLLTFILTASTVGFAQESKRDQKIAAEILQVLNAQTTAWNAGSIDDFMNGYWNSPDLVFVSSDNVT